MRMLRPTIIPNHCTLQTRASCVCVCVCTPHDVKSHPRARASHRMRPAQLRASVYEVVCVYGRVRANTHSLALSQTCFDNHIVISRTCAPTANYATMTSRAPVPFRSRVQTRRDIECTQPHAHTSREQTCTHPSAHITCSLSVCRVVVVNGDGDAGRGLRDSVLLQYSVTWDRCSSRE